MIFEVSLLWLVVYLVFAFILGFVFGAWLLYLGHKKIFVTTLVRFSKWMKKRGVMHTEQDIAKIASGEQE